LLILQKERRFLGKLKNKILLLDLIGLYFLILGIAAILRSFYNQVPYQILYSCYIGMILIGMGILTRRSFIILSQVYILAIPLLIWNVDFIHWIIFNKPLWGITDYFFVDFSSLIDKFISLQHLYTVPVAIYAANLVGIKRGDAWKWSIIQLSVTFFVVFIFSPEVSNINCVFKSCIGTNFGIPYILLWFFISFNMIFISVWIINSFFLHKKMKFHL
jgi:hypothetical protein